jgi:hypothetical protein
LHKELFGDSDALVVVDDWKAGTRAATAPIYFAGRLLLRSDQTLAQLYGLLSRDEAQHWHASGPRVSTRFLFDAPRFNEIVDVLAKSRSVLFDLLSTESAFKTEYALEQWRSIRTESSPQRFGQGMIRRPLRYFVLRSSCADIWLKCFRPEVACESL